MVSIETLVNWEFSKFPHLVIEVPEIDILSLIVGSALSQIVFKSMLTLRYHKTTLRPDWLIPNNFFFISLKALCA